MAYIYKELLNYKFYFSLEIRKEKTEKPEKPERKIQTKGECLILCFFSYFYLVYIFCTFIWEKGKFSCLVCLLILF